MNKKQSAGRWTVFTMLILAVSILGLAGAGLYANALVSKTAENTHGQDKHGKYRPSAC